MMGKPHKHAELIKAWADGADIQQRYDAAGALPQGKEWQAIGQFPSWAENFEYRIKPKTIRYRLCLWKDGCGRPYAAVAEEDDKSENSRFFVRWLGDWQEVEV